MSQQFLGLQQERKSKFFPLLSYRVALVWHFVQKLLGKWVVLPWEKWILRVIWVWELDWTDALVLLFFKAFFLFLLQSRVGNWNATEYKNKIYNYLTRFSKIFLYREIDFWIIVNRFSIFVTTSNVTVTSRYRSKRYHVGINTNFMNSQLANDI